MRMYRAKKARKSKLMKAAMAKKKTPNIFQEQAKNVIENNQSNASKIQKENLKTQRKNQANLNKLNVKKANSAIEKHEGRFNFY